MRSLIVIRTGGQGLFLPWLVDKKQRSYDVAISYYGDQAQQWQSMGEYFHYARGSKWEGLADFFKCYPKIWQAYDYIWLPDDDLAMSQGDLERFFQICRQHQFIVSQPSLMRGSFYSLPITLQRRANAYRLTNYVEVMAPCFQAKVFDAFLPTFSESNSGWGLEYIWWDIAKSIAKAPFAVVDEVAMYHTRPVSSAGSGGAKTAPKEEEIALLARHHLTKHPHKNLKICRRWYGFLFEKYLCRNKLFRWLRACPPDLAVHKYRRSR